MNDTHLLKRLAEANAYPPEADLPDRIRLRGLALQEIDRRIDMDTRQSTHTAPPPQQKRSGVLTAAAVFLVVLVVGVAAVLLTTRGEGAEPAAPPTTTAVEATPSTTTVDAAPPSTVPELSPEDALVAKVEEFIDDFHSTAFASAIGTIVYPNCHYIADTDRVRCDIAYSNDFYTVQEDPDVTIKWFMGNLVNVVVIDDDLPGDTAINALVHEYVESFDGWADACGDEPMIHESLACGTFYASHLDGWPAWYADNRGT